MLSLSVIDFVLNFSPTAVGEKHPTAARRDRLDSLCSLKNYPSECMLLDVRDVYK